MSIYSTEKILDTGFLKFPVNFNKQESLNQYTFKTDL